MPERRSAGLPLSVGNASIGVRLLVSLVFLITAALCLGGAIVIAHRSAAARVLATGLIAPLGLIGVVAAAFVLTPKSRFGVWLDHFVPTLREPRIAVTVAMLLWLIAFVLTE